MSAAIRATTARERANIAARFIRGCSTDGRAFSDCFEMGDGDEVLRLLLEKGDRNLAFMAQLRVVFAPEVFRSRDATATREG